MNAKSSMWGMLTLAASTLTLIVILVVLMFLEQSNLLREAQRQVTHTHEVTEEIQGLANKIKDMTLAQRGYLLTGVVAFLQEYESLLKAHLPQNNVVRSHVYYHSIEENIAHLQKLTSDNPRQQGRVILLHEAIMNLIEQLNDTIELRKNQKEAPLAETAALHDEKDIGMIHQILDDMMNEEAALLTLRTTQDEKHAETNITFVLIVISTFYIIKLILIAFIFRQFSETKRMEAESRQKSIDVAEANEKLRQAYEELEVLNKQIQESGETQLRAVIDHAVDGLIMLDTDGTVLKYNPACVAMFGFEVEEVIGQNVERLLADSCAQTYLNHLKERQRDGTSIGSDPAREIEGRRKNGEIFSIDLSMSSFMLGEKLFFSWFVRDITDRKRAQADLLRYMSELEKSNQDLDDFAYIASHDLKEPLRGLFNHASFLLEDYEDKLDDDGRRRLRRLSSLAQRMEQLVNDLLYFSRIGRAEMAIQPTDPNLTVLEIVHMMDSFLNERNAHVSIPAPMPIVTCDKPRIAEIFRNLITNAVKYNENEEKLIEVGFLEAMTSPMGVEKNIFYVKDNGIGIDPEYHLEIFRIFRRLKRAVEDDQSTGSGLTFVKKIVERHGGRIWLESALGQGTTFYFNLDPKEKHDDASV